MKPVTARYVRVQLPKAGFIHMAEVEVYGNPKPIKVAPPKPKVAKVPSSCFGKNIFYTTTGRGDAPSLGFKPVNQTVKSCANGTLTHLWAGIGEWSKVVDYKTVIVVNGKAHQQGILKFSKRSTQGYDKRDKKPTHNMAGAKLRVPVTVKAGDKVVISLKSPYPPKKVRVKAVPAKRFIIPKPGKPEKAVKKTYNLKFGPRKKSGYDSSGKNPINNMVTATLTPGIKVATGQAITVTIQGRRGSEVHRYHNGQIRMTLRDAKNNIIFGHWTDASTTTFSGTHKESVAALRSGTITKFHAGIGEWSHNSSYKVTIDTHPAKTRVPVGFEASKARPAYTTTVSHGEMHRYHDGVIRMTLQGAM